jgi:LPXTG-site transpeptidase (sortase) family protein
VTLSYTDEESNLATSCSVTGVANGSISTACACDASGVCTVGLSPNLNSIANVTANYTVSDGTSSNTSTITLSVTPVNDAPLFTSFEVTSATQDVVYTYNITTTDPDAGDTLSISITSLPSWLNFVDNSDGTATLSGTPTNADVGPHSIELVVTDSSSATASQSFIIDVGDVNDPPSFTSFPVTTAGESTPYTYAVVTTDPDPGNTLTISVPITDPLPVWLTLVDHGDRTATLSGTPNSSQVGTFHVVLQVTDNVVGSPAVTQEFDITVDNTAPQVLPNGINTVPITGDGISELEAVGVSVNQLTVQFNQDVYNVTDTGDATYPQSVSNPANYMLVRDLGDTAGFQTISCNGGAQVPADTSIQIGAVTYDAATHIATFAINGGLPLSNGNYRLYVCGTTSIVDIVDLTLELNGNGTPGTDFTRNFIVNINANGNTGGGATAAGTTAGTGGGDGGKKDKAGNAAFVTSGLLIPVTGFAPDQVTVLPAQPADKAYKPTNGMRIEIPTLGIDFPIVGATLSKTGWDLTWLQNNVAYLEGSAYPTWTGNTVLTAHVTDANDNIGPFSDIKGMKVGQFIYIHSEGQTFVYQVQENRKIAPSNISAVFEHEEYDWVTLVTCENYNEKTKSYKYRRMVRAVLISVIPQE